MEEKYGEKWEFITALPCDDELISEFTVNTMFETSSLMLSASRVKDIRDESHLMSYKWRGNSRYYKLTIKSDLDYSL